MVKLELEVNDLNHDDMVLEKQKSSRLGSSKVLPRALQGPSYGGKRSAAENASQGNLNFVYKKSSSFSLEYISEFRKHGYQKSGNQGNLFSTYCSDSAGRCYCVCWFPRFSIACASVLVKSLEVSKFTAAFLNVGGFQG